MISFTGTIVHSDKIGRRLGYPTANLRIDTEDKIIPGNGITMPYMQKYRANPD
ncbi:MAG: hypothetical protein IPP73_05030 [Chitinophagaceae bacterium]|nr:hypothetical protein [Chitinophagaceae bacterium]